MTVSGCTIVCSQIWVERNITGQILYRKILFVLTRTLHSGPEFCRSNGAFVIRVSHTTQLEGDGSNVCRIDPYLENFILIDEEQGAEASQRRRGRQVPFRISRSYPRKRLKYMRGRRSNAT